MSENWAGTPQIEKYIEKEKTQIYQGWVLNLELP